MARPTYANRSLELAERLDLRALLLRQIKPAGGSSRRASMFTLLEQIAIKQALEPILRAAIARSGNARSTAARPAPGRPALGNPPCRPLEVIAALVGTSASTLLRVEATVADIEPRIERVAFKATWPKTRNLHTRVVKELVERAFHADKCATPCVKAQVTPRSPKGSR